MGKRTVRTATALGTVLTVTVLALPGAARADGNAAVAADGNLWQITSSGDIHRVTPTGAKTTFEVPGGRDAEALTAERGSNRLWFTAKDPAAPQSSVTVHSLTTDGTFGAGAPLGFRATRETYRRQRYATVSSDGDVWVSRGWSPCVAGSGDLYRYRPSTGSVRRIAPPMNTSGGIANAIGPIAADRHSRVFARVMLSESSDETRCTDENDIIQETFISQAAFWTLDEKLWGYDQVNQVGLPCAAASGFSSSSFASDASGAMWCPNLTDANQYVEDPTNWWIYVFPKDFYAFQAFDTEATNAMFFSQYGTGVSSQRFASVGDTGVIRTYPELDPYTTWLPFDDDPTFISYTELQVSPSGAYWVLTLNDVLAQGPSLPGGQVTATVSRYNRDMFFGGTGRTGTTTTTDGEQTTTQQTGAGGPVSTTTATPLRVRSLTLRRTSVSVRMNRAARLRVRIARVIRRRAGRTRYKTVRTVRMSARANRNTKAIFRRLDRGRYRVTVLSGSKVLARRTVSALR